MEKWSLTYTREVLAGTVQLVSGNIAAIERELNKLLGRRTVSQKQIDKDIREKTKERLLRLLTEIYQNATMSVRRCLLQYLDARGYEVDEDHFEFTDELEEEELEVYIPMLMAQLSRFAPEEDGAFWAIRFRNLMEQGMWTEKDKENEAGCRLCEMTKENAYTLGHMLHFSAEEMEALMVRALENEGFVCTQAKDMIHLFCFLTYRSASEAAEMIEEYDNYAKPFAQKKVKVQDKIPGFTQGIPDMLESMVQTWTDEKDGRAQFMAWLKSQVCYLDVPSRSAHDLFYRLAQYYSQIDSSHQNAGDMADDILEIINEDERLVWNRQSAATLGRFLLLGGEYEKKLREKGMRECAPDWFYLHRTPGGQMKKVVVGERVVPILQGEMEPTKADFLVLLYKIFQVFFPTADGVIMAIDYMDFATQILEKCNLYFYLPHTLEFTLVSSIVSCSVVTDADLDVLLDEVNESKVQPRKKKKASAKGRKSGRESERISAVAAELCVIAEKEKLRPVVECLGQYFATRAQDDQVIFKPNPGNKGEELMQLLRNGGTVYEHLKAGIGAEICRVPALDQEDLSCIAKHAEQIMEDVYKIDDEKNAGAAQKLYDQKDIETARNKLYLSIIGHAIGKEYPTMEFKVNGKSKLLMTLK